MVIRYRACSLRRCETLQPVGLVEEFVDMVQEADSPGAVPREVSSFERCPVNDFERLRVALDKIARFSHHQLRAADAASEMSKIAWDALQEVGTNPGENPEVIEVLIRKLKKTSMTTTEKLQQWNPQQCSFDELLELRAAARALRGEYAAHQLDSPQWLPKAESYLDDEIELRGQSKRLRALGELKKEREALRAVEERKTGLDQQIAHYEAAL